LKWHPKLSKNDPDVTFHNFSEISEAYEVLGDPYKKSFYDKYGEEKLKDGILIDGNFKGGYRFGGNPEEVFEKFFGTNNPFAYIIDNKGDEELGSLFGFAFGGLNYKGPTSIANLEVVVECTLNELYNGCSKKISYNRTVLNPDGKTTKDILETKVIEIKKGYNNDSKLVFKGNGHEAAGLPNSDLIFKIKELSHPLFKRKVNDLIYTCKIDLINALCCDPIAITTLDSRKLFVPIDEIISPKTLKLVKAEGMPILDESMNKVENFNKPNPKGDLYIKFDIVFPTSLSEDQKNELRINLSPN